MGRRLRFSPCSCGFFCADCLRLMVKYEHGFRGIFWHIVYHTPLGHIYFRVTVKTNYEE